MARPGRRYAPGVLPQHVVYAPGSRTQRAAGMRHGATARGETSAPARRAAVAGTGQALRAPPPPLTFEVSALLPISLGPTGDCSCRD